ncbi:MAG: pyruvate kinase, partial [Clostridia bacterium]|nr:pyruvate kinase [Clostridia bacterium]
MRKTKIVCTIGPACSNKETITAMCLAGMNVARLNFSHGTHEYHLENIRIIKEVREELDMPIAILLDTKGPEYRIRTFENGKVMLKEGDTFAFTVDEIVGNESRVSVSYKGMIDDLEIGDKILLNNGLLAFTVTSLTDTDAVCRVDIGGELSDRKSMAFPGKVLKQVFLSEQDKADIKLGIDEGVDFIACSFVSCRQDLLDVKAFLNENGCSDTDIELIARIENRSGIENIEEICTECSGIMIGRGDMG